ncbi:MAG: GAK system XXXCH domain-containing protein [Solidesulfovibrio sp. DCME]|uniref:GAK system XXXCH domain-containing protein n=1 Tax=Solidesulfovibrio sp. DCME TaxID=3447380 RepID=UPI003D0E4CAF
MPPSRKRKFEMVLPRVEALRALAELTAKAGEGSLVIGEETVALEDFTSLKIGIKHLGASCLLKVSLKYPALGVAALPSPASMDAEEAAPREQAVDSAPEPMDEGGKPRYKSLKKRMKHFFKAIVTSLRAGLPPDADILAAFVADSRLMTSYPGKGDDFYPAYDAEVDRLEAAAAGGDLDAMTASVAALGRMKKECHSRHA